MFRRRLPNTCLALFCFFLAVAADRARAEARPLRYAMAPAAQTLLKESNTLFQSAIKDKLAAVLEINEVPGGGSRAIRESLRSGALDAAILPASIFPASVGEYVTGSDLAGSRRRQESEIGAYQLALLESEGLVGLAFWNAPPAQVILSREISTLAQLRGTKILANGSPSQQVLAELGANTVSVSGGEIFAALTTGLADAAEIQPDLPLDQFLPGGQFKSAITDVKGATEFFFIVRKEYWIGLPYRAQVELANAARAAARKSDEVAQQRVNNNLEALSSGGLRVVNFAATEMNGLRKASFSAWSRNGSGRDVNILDRAYAVSKPVARSAVSPAGNTVQRREVFFGTVREFENEPEVEYQFTNRLRDDGPLYGIANVTLKEGRSLDDDLNQFTTVESLERFPSAAAFKERISAVPAANGSRGILVFVHGYNNNFLDAVRRGAQFAVDIGFDGPVVVFSWPSDGTTALYAHDEDRVYGTRFGFATFMDTMESIKPRDGINLVAHSMGARVVLDYTGTLKLKADSAKKGKYRSLIFVAADTPIEYFRQQTGFLRGIATSKSVYFSENDRALWLSNALHRIVRLGNIPEKQLFLDRESAALKNSGFDFINAAQIDNATLTFSPRHNYIFEKKQGVADVKALLLRQLTADKRNAENPTALAAKQNNEGRY